VLLDSKIHTTRFKRAAVEEGEKQMSGKNKQLPASSAGLLRFFEDETEGVKIKPEIILVASMGLVVTSIVINQLFPAPASTGSAGTAFLALLFG
jgi:preprotein translocase subunit Sec61beta